MPQADAHTVSQLQILRFPGADPFRNLALESYLVSMAEPGTVLLCLWQNDPSVIIGCTQDAAAECDLPAMDADGVHLVRRYSGGGAVYQDLGNLNFTFIACDPDYDQGRQTRVVLEAVRSLGISCKASGRNDLVATCDGERDRNGDSDGDDDPRKFSGHAFTQQGKKHAHHGTLMVHVDVDGLARYLTPSAQKLRKHRTASVRTRVTNLRDLRPDLTVGLLEDALITAFQQEYEKAAQLLELDDLRTFDPNWEANVTRRAAELKDPAWVHQETSGSDAL